MMNSNITTAAHLQDGVGGLNGAIANMTEEETLCHLTLTLWHIWKSGDYANPSFSYYLSPDFKVVSPTHPNGHIPAMVKWPVDAEVARYQARQHPDYSPDPRSTTVQIFPKAGYGREYAVVWMTMQTKGDFEEVRWRELVNQFWWRKEGGRWKMWKKEETTGVAFGV